jgi:hypothetical protein
MRGVRPYQVRNFCCLRLPLLSVKYQGIQDMARLPSLSNQARVFLQNFPHVRNANSLVGGKLEFANVS